MPTKYNESLSMQIKLVLAIGGGGQVVSVFAFYSDGMSSNPFIV